MRLIIGMTVMLSLLSFNVSAHEDGLKNVKSTYNVSETADRLESVLKEKGMTIFNRINHAEGAKKVGEELRPTELVVFGNPKVGTKLMQCSQRIGIDLPLKALIWEDESNRTWLSYNDPKYITDRHGVKSACDKVIRKINNALTKITDIATGKK